MAANNTAAAEVTDAAAVTHNTQHHQLDEEVRATQEDETRQAASRDPQPDTSGDGDSVSGHEVDLHEASEDELVTALRQAIRGKDWDKIMHILSVTWLREDETVLKMCFRAAKWQCAWDCLMGIFALTESDKDITNFLVNELFKLVTHHSSEGNTRCRVFMRHLHKSGHTTFAFDLALTLSSWEEALRMVEATEEKGVEAVVSLLDVAAQVTSDYVTRFVDHCLKAGLTDFSLGLSAVLKQWPRALEIMQSETLTTNYLTGFAFRKGIIGGSWDFVHCCLEKLTEEEVASEVLFLPHTVDAGPLFDRLVDKGYVTLALRVAASHGLWEKALPVINMVQAVHNIAWLARRAFEADVAALEDFVGKGLDLELKRTILGRPRTLSFSENQWRCVLKLVEDGWLDQNVLEWIARKAAQEDCQCLTRLIGHGEPPVDHQLMTVLLKTNPTGSLSENQWSCVEEILRREAEEKSLLKKEARRRASSIMLGRLSVVKEDTAVLEDLNEVDAVELREGNAVQNGDVGLENRRISCVEPVDFTSTLDRSCSSEYETKDPWNRVTSILDMMDGDSQYLSMLAERAAREEKWLTLKFWTWRDHSVSENAMDLIFKVKHQKLEDELAEENGRISDGFLHYQYGGVDTRWRSFDFQILDTVHVICFGANHSLSDDVMQDRHKTILLRRAVSLGHWHKVEEIISVGGGLYPSQRPWVYKMAVDAQKWTVALQVLDQGLQEIPARMWVHPAKSLKDLTTQETAFVERGLCNPYFTSTVNKLRQCQELDAKYSVDYQAKVIAAGNTGNKQTSSGKNSPRIFVRCDPPGKRVSATSGEGVKSDLPAGKPARKSSPSSVMSRMKRVSCLLKVDTHTVGGGKVAHKPGKTMAVEKNLQKAVSRGDWTLVMTLYRGGLREEVKKLVFDEAVRQQKWHIVLTLIRRDPEAGSLYHHYKQAMFDTEGCLHPELLEALVELGMPHDDRDNFAELCILNRWWPQLLVLALAGISETWRRQGLAQIIRRNEWTFVNDYVQTGFVWDEERLNMLDQALDKRIWPVVTALVTHSTPTVKVSRVILEAVKAGNESVVEACMIRCAHARRVLSAEVTCTDDDDEDDVSIDHCKGEDGSTALQLAVWRGMWTTMDFLLQLGADPDPPPTPSCPLPLLVKAARRQKIKVIGQLLDSGARAEGKESVLHELMLRNPVPDQVVPILCKLLRKGANPTEILCPEIPFSPLRSALECDRLHVGSERLSDEIVRILIEAGASPYQASLSDGLYSLPRSNIFKPPCTPLPFPQPLRACDESEPLRHGQCTDVCVTSPSPCPSSETIFCVSPVYKAPDIIVEGSAGSNSVAHLPTSSSGFSSQVSPSSSSSSISFVVPTMMSPPPRPPRPPSQVMSQVTSQTTSATRPVSLKMSASTSDTTQDQAPEIPSRCPVSPVPAPISPLQFPHRPPPPPPPTPSLTSSSFEAANAGPDEDYPVAKSLLNNCPVYLYLHGHQGCSPMKKALDTGRLSTVRLLYESGSASRSEMSRWYDGFSSCQMMDKGSKLKDVFDYVRKSLVSPASLKQQCRLLVSRVIGWRDRHARVKKLPVTPELQDYVMFRDVLSCGDGTVYQWKLLADVEN